ncbi:MAG: NosD domain-containing protein [Candidatus Bathyarchaeia archaeon]
MVEIKAESGNLVRNVNTGKDYTTIQAAIDDPQTLNGHTLYVKNGIYYENVIINKSLSLIGENKSNTIIQGNGGGTVVFIVVNNVTLRGFTVMNGSNGAFVENADNCLIMDNNFTQNVDAILVRYSANCTIRQNIIGNNTNRGLLITNSRDFTVSNNHVYGNKEYGINANASLNGVISQNNVYENYHDGIGIVFYSSNCVIAENNVSRNEWWGIYISEFSTNNILYHNNIINNTVQASDVSSSNQWDDDLEGNYWSNYVGVDENYDGIGDTPHYIMEGESYRDEHPLMGMFHCFSTSYNHQVNVISNSSISDFDFSLVNETHAALNLNVSGEINNQGFCRIRIPKILINGSYVVKFNEEIITNTTYPQVRELTCSNETYEYLYVNYTHSGHRIEIIGTTAISEFPLMVILPMFMLTTLIVVVKVYRKKPH